MINVPKYNYCDIGKRIQAGEASVFGGFFQEFYTPVYNRALKVLKNHHDAEDATQGVFIKVWENKTKWNASGGTFMGWFLTLAERSIIDVYRKKQSLIKKTLSLDYEYGNPENADDVQTLLELVPDYKSDPLGLMIDDETMTLIETALLTVSKREHRLAWILRHIEGYSQLEIAEIMGSPVGSCKMWIHRCQHTLRTYLEKSYSSGSRELRSRIS